MAILSLCVLSLSLRVSALPSGDFAPVMRGTITPPVIVDVSQSTRAVPLNNAQLTPKVIGGVNAGAPYRWIGFSYVMNAAHTGFNGCGGSLIWDYSGPGCNSDADCEADEACRPFEDSPAKRCQVGWYLSAAHCQKEGIFVVPNLYRVPYVRWNASKLNSASPPQERASCIEVHVHSEYNPTTVAHDLAMCKLERPPAVSTPLASLATPEQDRAFTSATNILKTIGWGLTQAGTIPNDLQELDLRVVDNAVCQQLMPNVRATQLCAGGNISGSVGRDICSGDSGGPIFFAPPPLSQYPSASVKPVVLGITSYGFGCVSGYPGVWSRVASYRDWIINTQMCSRRSKTEDCNSIPGCRLVYRSTDSSSTCQAIPVITPTGTSAVPATRPPVVPPTTPARSTPPPTARRITPTVPTRAPSVMTNAETAVEATLVVRTNLALNLTKFRQDLAPLLGVHMRKISILSSDSLVRTGIPMMELRISVLATTPLLDSVTGRLSNGNVLVSQAAYDVRASYLGTDRQYDCDDNPNWRSAYGTQCWSYYQGEANFGKCLAHGAATQSLATRGPCPRACGECFPRVCKDSTELVAGYACEMYAPNGPLNSQCSREEVSAACPAACEICIPPRCMDDPSFSCHLYGPGVSPADPLYPGFGRPSPLSPSIASSSNRRLLSCDEDGAAFRCPATCGVCSCRDSRPGEWRGRQGQCASYPDTPLPCYQSGVLSQCPVSCAYCLETTSVTCGAKSAFCSRSSDCCSSQCSNGSCQCSAIGASCTSNADCCVSPTKGVCGREGKCQACRQVQDRCERDSDCCTGTCSSLSVCVSATL